MSRDVVQWILDIFGCNGKTGKFEAKFAESDIGIVFRAGINHQAAEILSHAPTNGQEESPLEDIVPVLTEADVHYGDYNSEMDQHHCFKLDWETCENLIQSGICLVLQVADGTEKKREFTTVKSVTFQVNDPCSREIKNTISKPESIYL